MNHAPTLYWHDYETFGANPRLDRPAQFAGVRTDENLNVIGDPLVLYCQPPDDVLPHPEACLITGITPQAASERGLPEREFIARVHTELAEPGTCAVGYNSLRFDDEVTRHALWRNFFDPYRREWADGCSRWDIIDMVRLTFALRPEGIEWPCREDGCPSFRLEDLAEANGLDQARAHDALSDVYATIALARLIRARQPRLYDFVFRNRDKRSARAMLDLNRYKPVLHVSDKFPAETGCLSPVMPIAPHPVNSNAIIVFDLRHDPEPLLRLPPDQVRERLFTPADGLPDEVDRIPLKGVHVNKCPVLAPVETLNDERAQRLRLNLDDCRRHWKLLREDVAAVTEKVRAVYTSGEFEPATDPEQGLYDGFVNDGDRRLCDRVRELTGRQLATDPPPFEDERLRKMLFRYRARNFPDSLNEDERGRWRAWCESRLRFAPDGGLALNDYEALLSQLSERFAADPEKARVLADLRAWGERLQALAGKKEPADRRALSG